MIKHGRSDSEVVASRRTQRRETVASQRKTMRPGRRTQSKLNPCYNRLKSHQADAGGRKRCVPEKKTMRPGRMTQSKINPCL